MIQWIKCLFGLHDVWREDECIREAGKLKLLSSHKWCMACKKEL